MPSFRRPRPRRQALGPLAAIVSVTCAAGSSAPARADDAPCSSAPVSVSIGGGLDPRWLEATREVCASLDRLRDLDRSARLTIEASVRAGEVRVRVDLADGRSAVREVALPAHLLHVVEGLVTMPPAPTASPPPPTASPPPPPAPGKPAPGKPAPGKPPAKRPPSAVAAASPPREDDDTRTGLAHVEVGAQVVGRLAGSPGYGSVGLALAGDVHVDGWLVGLAARWDPAVFLLADPPEDFEMTSFGGGLEVGRRFRIHEGVDLDVGLGLHVLGELQSIQTPGSEPEEEGDERAEGDDVHTTATAFDVRAQPWVQLHVGEGSVRPTATLAFEVSPLRAGRDLTASAGLPPLPSWGFSLGLGASWDGP